MNIVRALLFSIMLYAASFVVYALSSFIGFSEDPTLGQYILFWILNIPLTLYLAKWYFRVQEPTLKHGVLLGIIAVLVAFFFDGVSIGATAAAGKSIEVFKNMYGDWKFYVTVFEIIALCAFAGYEFDKTYTKK